jgi:Protein of unknown function (DUF1194)
MRSHGGFLRWPRIGAAVLLLCAVATSGATEPQAPPAEQEVPVVCAQVVIAIDGSRSAREDAFFRQIRSLRAAFASEPLYHAVQDCLPGSVAFAVMTWSGAQEQDRCLDWSLVTQRADGRRLAGQFERCRYFGGSTDIGGAVQYGLRLLERAPLASYYRTILLLTNGRTDRGAEASLAAARAQAAAAGVTLAGYALLRPEPASQSPFYVPAARPLERYVADHVSAGPRAFSAFSRPEEDGEALLRALVEMLRQESS